MLLELEPRGQASLAAGERNGALQIPASSVSRRELMTGSALAIAATLRARTALGDTPSAQRQRLFHIARSKNANIVVYDLNLTEHGLLRVTEPVSAYWLLNADRGQREGLGWLERRMAYGFEVLPPITTSGFRLELKASRGRTLFVRRWGNAFIATTKISNIPARLGKIFVRTDETSTFPSVVYVDLIGSALADGRAVKERLRP